MSVAKSFEIALSRMLRQTTDLDGVVFRPWQTLADDATWDKSKDRDFPAIEFRASSPAFDENQSTMSCECVITIGTNADDDASHEEISDIYGKVFSSVQNLFAGFRSGSGSDELTAFSSVMSDLTTAAQYQFGGLTIGDSGAPFEDRGINYISINVRVHYSSSAF